VLRLFAQAREAAGRSTDSVPGATVDEVIQAACTRYGSSFSQVVPICRVWVNGEPAERSLNVQSTDEIALLPPVSGG
jgi:molybdopterin synthase sulfur carrier subunit